MRSLRWPLIAIGVVVALVIGALVVERLAREVAGRQHVRHATLPVCAGADCLPPLGEQLLAGPRVAAEHLRGRVVVVNFWAPWCGPCLEEMPALEAVWRRHRDAGLVVVGVLVERSMGVEGARRFVEERGVTYPVLMLTDELEARTGVEVLPTTLLYGRDGRLRRRWRRAVDVRVLEAEIEGLLAPVGGAAKAGAEAEAEAPR